MNKLKILYTTVGGVTSPQTINALKSYKKGCKVIIYGTDKNVDKVALNFSNVKKILEEFTTYN